MILKDAIDVHAGRCASVLEGVVRDAFLRSPGSRLFLRQQDVSKILATLTRTLAAADVLGRWKIYAPPGVIALSEFVVDEWVALDPSPEEAIRKFEKLATSARDDGVRSHPKIAAIQGEAFTIAASTSKEVTARVNAVIVRRMETGKGNGARDVEEILKEAGVSRGSAYSEAVFRTATMERYRTGGMEEMRSMPDAFPAWKYLGIADGRERHGPAPLPDHRQHFGKYFSASVDFRDVRGRDAQNVINCRCDFQAISSSAWRGLVLRGEKLER